MTKKSNPNQNKLFVKISISTNLPLFFMKRLIRPFSQYLNDHIEWYLWHLNINQINRIIVKRRSQRIVYAVPLTMDFFVNYSIQVILPLSPADLSFLERSFFPKSLTKKSSQNKLFVRTFCKKFDFKKFGYMFYETIYQALFTLSQ